MSAKDHIRAMLSGENRRSIGRVAENIDLISHDPKMISFLIDCLWDGDACVRMRAANALEKISCEQVTHLHSHTDQLQGLLAETTQQEVRWHLALILPRLTQRFKSFPPFWA